MKKGILVLTTLTLAAATTAPAGTKIAGPRETTIDEPFCAG
jgi:hypothetical protein